MTRNDIFTTIPGPLSSLDLIFAQLKFMKIEDIYKYQVSKFVFKCLNHTFLLIRNYKKNYDYFIRYYYFIISFCKKQVYFV